MSYCALVVGVPYELFDALNIHLKKSDIKLTYALTVSDGIRSFIKQTYQLIIVDLREISRTSRIEVLAGLRQARYTPIFTLTGEECIEDIVQLMEYGVDVSMPEAIPPVLLAQQAKALIRRYTAYNHYDQPRGAETIPFQCGDIFIDPLRYGVFVRGEPVSLCRREFSLLLYFMRNPQIVLSAEQICRGAWEMEDGYASGVSHPIRELRKLIEPDPASPVYIESVYGMGYRFTGRCVESCDESR